MFARGPEAPEKPRPGTRLTVLPVDYPACELPSSPSRRRRRIRFRVIDVTLTVQVVARREKEGSGKLRWWLIEAGAQASSGRETTQTLVLTLHPGVHDGDVEPGPLDVHGKESAPAG